MRVIVMLSWVYGCCTYDAHMQLEEVEPQNPSARDYAKARQRLVARRDVRSRHNSIHVVD
jgi:hypothetical protein